MEKFSTFEQLAKFARSGKDFLIEVRAGTSGTVIMAPHGGRIEPGTAEIADAIAGGNHGCYAFKGIRPEHNRPLHLPSTRFDEPHAVELIRNCHCVVTIHGCRGEGKEIHVGGRDTSLMARVSRRLSLCGFKTSRARTDGLKGLHPNNLCNRGSRGKGVQLEISGPLRRDLVGNNTVSHARPAPQLQRFAHAVRQGLEDDVTGNPKECP